MYKLRFRPLARAFFVCELDGRRPSSRQPHLIAFNCGRQPYRDVMVMIAVLAAVGFCHLDATTLYLV